MTDTIQTTSNIYLEDGPLFRATMKEYEDRTIFLKSDLKEMISAATCSFKARQHLLETEQAFVKSIKKANFTHPLFDYYLDHVLEKWMEQQERLHFCLQSLVIDPLKKIYELDVKVADTKRKQFEEISKEYYVHLSKYLSNSSNSSSSSSSSSSNNNSGSNNNSKSMLERRRPSSQLEFNRKKQHFDLARFDYYTFLTDLHGKKEQEILYHLLHHYEKQYAFYHETCKTLEQKKSGLEDVASYIADASREQQIMNRERNEKRRQIESNYAITIVHSDDPLDKYSGIRDLQQTDKSYLGQKKEGFLFTSSRPSKRKNSHTFPGDHWHNKGQLQEYTNWKHHLQTHNQPIILKLATVKEARDAGRRFCFEVITPAVSRTYQATSKEEMANWMATINNAICESLNGTGSCIAFSESTLSEGSSVEKTISKALDGIVKLRPRRSRRRTINRRSVVYSEKPKCTQWLLQQLYEHDVANTFCADCSSPFPDWCSLNLGVLLCIDCSGVHRSLGTHISKVRSLTLDSESLTPERIQILKWIGNQRFNALWEPQPINKPVASDTRETKARYIREKYVAKCFLKPTNDPPSHLLLQGILQNHLPLVLYALALGLDLNQPFSDSVYLPQELAGAPRYPLMLALMKDYCDQEEEEEKMFPLAELLLQNGCDIQDPVADWIAHCPIDDIIDYLNVKSELRGYAPIKRKSYKSA
ncbi:hypothetical protein CU098_001915 [Rhizopus stolonifer]|uniref:Uncharacterized protein n=1 Tax=Rhizopus stolonifer TaxID=4846 RepID=A0A367J323_RHIST|nr:hypothetical protein CU098_001915 [Rhizopus stolonifer]